MINENGPVRVLQINAGSKDFGGVSSFLYNIYRHVDRSKVQFDFLSPNVTTYGLHRNQIEAMGGRVFELGVEGNPIIRKVRLYHRLRDKIKQQSYPVVHINSGSVFFNLTAAMAAKHAGARVRIVHSHSAGTAIKNKIAKLLVGWLKLTLERYATNLLACSKAAGEHVFSEKSVLQGKVEIVPNGIEISRFVFDGKTRETVRRELGLDGRFVVGHVGRFSEEKNHSFLIDVFSEVYRRELSAVLLLIGEGPLEAEIRDKVRRCGLGGCVRFLGVRRDVERLYQAMDCFVLPSLFEGLPIVGIEAQTAGLRMVCSDAITEEMRITDLAEYMSLGEPAVRWAEKILCCRGSERKNMSREIAEAGYSIENSARQLEALYLER